jgi:hypothetical protein
MDVAYFLRERTRLIRQYYASASEPFRETMRKIDAEEEPFVPGYSEDPEPAFLTEWLEAREFLEVTGRCCLSMLAASLMLFFRNWERQLGLSGKAIAREEFKSGSLHGYRFCFEQVSGVDWSSCPANLGLIEQIVLARNRDQHPEEIWTLGVSHSEKDRARYPSPFFLQDDEHGLLDEPGETTPWMNASLHVSAEKLEVAIAEVERLGDWLEDCLVRVQYPHYRG